MQACELKKRLATHTSSSPGPPRSYIEANTTQPRPSPVAYKEPGGATTGLTAVTACMGTQMMGTRDRDPTGRVVAFGAGGGARFVWGERADVKVSMGPSDGAWEDGYLRELRPRSSDLARPAQIQRVQRLLSVAEAEQSKS
ncbi:hypothetical protein TEQG_00447 [Trichophyton equinum CBS 127.97]|uniref:Uncharacterized protein n=1 Tax=Trichophyton equinum (strain ATCC MYA-4606 / CBS 127.97) TaxID=559882 RepID=F2PHM6_TRIEC|nr:hypothetical protein TEQG_00447 [Trichophyton equinum CBS 127.97]